MKDEILPIAESEFKYSPLDPEKDNTMKPRSQRQSRPFLVAFSIIAFSYLLWTSSTASPLFHHICGTHKNQTVSASVPTISEKTLVPLEAHIMSKCPDAQDCLRMMVLPTMQRVLDKVNFTLSYIGTPTDNDGVDCMHGPEECMGNIIELCAEKLYPDPKIYLGFTMCLTRDYQDIPQEDLIKDCALEHGIDTEKLSDCAVEDGGGLGIGMLRDSIRRSTQAGVTKSCTVRLNEEIYCVRDGGEWKECPNGAGVNDLVIAVEKLYQGTRS